MNPLVFTIVKWEKELEIQREGHGPRRNDDLEAIKPLLQPKKTERKVATNAIRESAPCHCPAGSD